MSAIRFNKSAGCQLVFAERVCDTVVVDWLCLGSLSGSN